MRNPLGPPSPSLRSGGIPTLRGKLLTDSRIAHYIRQGFYGPVRQAELLKAEKKLTPTEHAIKILRKLA